MKNKQRITEINSKCCIVLTVFYNQKYSIAYFVLQIRFCFFFKPSLGVNSF